MDHPPARVRGLLLPPELWPRGLDRADASHVPPDAQVHLLDLPILDEDGAPDAGEDGVGEGVLRQELPREEPRDGGEGEEDDVGLDEREVKSDLGLSALVGSGKGYGAHLCPEEITDLVEVTSGEHQPAAEMLQQGEVRDFVVKGKDGLDILPLAPPRRDPGTAIGLRPIDEVVDREDVLSLEGTVDNLG